MKPLLKPRTPEREAIDKKRPKKKAKFWIYEFQNNDKSWSVKWFHGPYVSAENAKAQIEKHLRSYGANILFGHPNGVRTRLRNKVTNEIKDFKIIKPDNKVIFL